MTTDDVLVASNVSKSFPGVNALSDVSIRLARGSIHALLGENGAGKSTLIKIITGVYRPNSGTLTLDGAPLHFNGPRDAIAAGVGVVHQERNLIPRFSVGENIMLDRLGGGFLRPIDYDNVHAQAKDWLDLLGLELELAHDGIENSASLRCRWSKSPRRCRFAPACCCSTSPRPP